MSNQILFSILSLLAGVMIPFQSAMNSQLGKSLKSPYYASLTAFLVAIAGIACFIVASHPSIPLKSQFNLTPKWSYLGGLLGGIYILLIVICAPKLGIGNTTVMVLLGQVLAALIIDQFGLLNAPVHAMNWPRLAGVIMLVAGIYLVQKA